MSISLLDIVASLLNCLHQLRQENQRLEDHIQNLSARRDHLLAVNARLALPHAPIHNQNGAQQPPNNNNNIGGGGAGGVGVGALAGLGAAASTLAGLGVYKEIRLFSFIKLLIINNFINETNNYFAIFSINPIGRFYIGWNRCVYKNKF